MRPSHGAAAAGLPQRHVHEPPALERAARSTRHEGRARSADPRAVPDRGAARALHARAALLHRVGKAHREYARRFADSLAVLPDDVRAPAVPADDRALERRGGTADPYERRRSRKGRGKRHRGRNPRHGGHRRGKGRDREQRKGADRERPRVQQHHRRGLHDPPHRRDRRGRGHQRGGVRRSGARDRLFALPRL